MNRVGRSGSAWFISEAGNSLSAGSFSPLPPLAASTAPSPPLPALLLTEVVAAALIGDYYYYY